MSRPYFKDKKNVPFALKSIRRMTVSHSGRRDQDDEEKDIIAIEYPEAGLGDLVNRRLTKIFFG